MTMTIKSFSIIKTCEKISKGSIYLLAFLLPIFFLPWTANALDFNKQALLIVLVFISLFAWLLKILISGKFNFCFNWVHLPIVVLFLVYLVSTIFSLWPYGSFWGWPQITSESLLSLLGLLILYFLVINIFEKREIFYLVNLLIISGFLAIILGILQIFGKFLFPFNFTKITAFNTIGGVNSLGVFTAVLLPLIIVLIIVNTKLFWRVFFIVTAVSSTIFLILVNFPIAWWLVMGGSILIITFGTQKRDLFDTRWLILPMFFLALALFLSLFKYQLPGLPARPIEYFLTHRASFNISRQILKENPFFGSGPGTFVYDFSKYKSIDFNQSPFWNVRFEGGSSKILTLLSTTGILGVISFLALIGFFLFYGIKSLFKKTAGIVTRNFGVSHNSGRIRISIKKESEEISPSVEEGINEIFLWKWRLGILISFVVLSIGYFLYQSNLTLDFVYFLLMASFISLLLPDNPPLFIKDGGKKEFLLKPSSLITLSVTFIFILVFIFGLWIIILGEQRYIASANYLKGVKIWQEGRKIDALSYLVKAPSLNPKVDLYWQELSQAYLQSIDEVAKSKDLSHEEINQRIQSFVENAVNSARAATKLNPKNVANWSVQGFIYQNLTGVVKETEDWAVKSYEEALNLEPTNAYFPTQAGISLLKKVNFLPQEEVAEREKILSEAQAQFKKAIELKPDYAPVHFQLAAIYQTQGKQAAAVEELEKARSSAPNDIGLAFQLGLLYYQNKDYQKAQNELERAVFIDPNYSNALYFLGLTYDQLGEKTKAIEKLERVALLNPDNSEVKKILENLKAGREALKGVAEEVPPTIPIEEEHPEIEE